MWMLYFGISALISFIFFAADLLSGSAFFFQFFLSLALTGLILGIIFVVVISAVLAISKFAPRSICALMMVSTYVGLFVIWMAFCANSLNSAEQNGQIENYWWYFINALFFVSWPIRIMRQMVLSPKFQRKMAEEGVNPLRIKKLMPKLWAATLIAPVLPWGIVAVLINFPQAIFALGGEILSPYIVVEKLSPLAGAICFFFVAINWVIIPACRLYFMAARKWKQEKQ